MRKVLYALAALAAVVAGGVGISHAVEQHQQEVRMTRFNSAAWQHVRADAQMYHILKECLGQEVEVFSERSIMSLYAGYGLSYNALQYIKSSYSVGEMMHRPGCVDYQTRLKALAGEAGEAMETVKEMTGF